MVTTTSLRSLAVVTRLALALATLCCVSLPCQQTPASGGVSAEKAAPTERQQPNILFCIADDWGWPHASIYGDPTVKTPAFDRVAREGVLFDQCYVASPSCTPSRNAILTGQFHWRLGAGANLWSSLDVEIPVYPLLLESSGYHVGHWRKAWGPGRLKPGGYEKQDPAGKNYRKGFAEFLAARPEGKPFCFWLGAWDPHRGYERGSGAKSGMDIDSVRVPPFWPDVAEIRSDIADYYFEVQRFDRDVGAALRLLEERGELENTIVVVTGDHGMPFPRCKSNCYDMGVRVPLAIRWGKRIEAGRRVAEFVSLVDLAPTFLRAAKVSVPAAMNGSSLLPFLRNERDREPQQIAARQHVIFGKERHVPCRPDHSGYPTRGIRTADWALLRNFAPERWPVGDPPLYGDVDPARSVGLGTTKGYILTHQKEAAVQQSYAWCFGKRPRLELYDMRNDPDQLRNLAESPEHREVRDELWQKLRAELERTGDPRVLGGAEAFDRFPYYGGSAWRAPGDGRTKGRKKGSQGK